MSDMMTFPDTWEEFEKSYGFTDNEEVYTNGARLIPSFRVKQWLDHLPSVQQEQLDCEDCIKNGGDWECDRVHCHKGDVPDTNVGELISRQEAIEEIYQLLKDLPNKKNSLLFKDGVRDGYARAIGRIRSMPSAQPQKGKWIIDNPHSEMYRYACSECHAHHRARYDFCPSCGADMRGEEQ